MKKRALYNRAELLLLYYADCVKMFTKYVAMLCCFVVATQLNIVG